MNIVVLDGHTTNPGDLSWDALQRLGECRIYDRTPENKIIERLADAEIVITNKVPLSSVTLEKLPKLRYIGVIATGFNCVDAVAARKRNIPVTNVPSYGTTSVAQAAIALLLELTNGVGEHSRSVREGRWCSSPDFCYWLTPQVELHDLTLGILGYGSIGRAVGKIAGAMGMKVIVHTRSAPADGARNVELRHLIGESDAISLHCPLTPETKELINVTTLSQMKKSAFLINTSRGGLIHEQSLADALNKEQIAGAGLDVLSVEPPVQTNPLLKAKNCIITPHIAWASHAARKRLLGVAVENVRAFIEGHPRNVVN
jgi:glycerate dehydrogenase